MRNYSDIYVEMEKEITEYFRVGLLANDAVLNIDFYKADVDLIDIIINGTLTYDKFEVFISASICGDVVEVDGWTFESLQTSNDAAYFYNLVSIFEGKVPKRMEVER